MTSTMRFDKWENSLGQPYGTVLQVVSVTKTNTFSTASTTYVDVPDLSITITPKAANSKFLVSAFGYSSHSADNGFAQLKIVRNGGDIFIGDARGAAPRISADLSQQAAGGVIYWSKNFSLQFLDSPATSGSFTYKVQIKVSLQSVVIGGTWNTDDGNRANTPTSFTIMEIAQ
jgi:hypothetical protein